MALADAGAAGGALAEAAAGVDVAALTAAAVPALVAAADASGADGAFVISAVLGAASLMRAAASCGGSTPIVGALAGFAAALPLESV
ncbi:MAG: hypothetical protein ACLPKB_13055 [Xanthobacteraceae bacterium]